MKSLSLGSSSSWMSSSKTCAMLAVATAFLCINSFDNGVEICGSAATWLSWDCNAIVDETEQ